MDGSKLLMNTHEAIIAIIKKYIILTLLAVMVHGPEASLLKPRGITTHHGSSVAQVFG